MGRTDQQFLKQIGGRIRALREEQGYTPVRFAEKVGIERAYMSDIETGKHSVGILILRHIAEALNVPLGSLLE